MPTYAYKCESCGFGKDEWLKMSEAHAELVCPSCGQPTYRKQLTAAAFHLKGGGWYASDFKGGASAPAKTDTATASDAAGCACPGAQACPAVKAAAESASTSSS